MKSPPGFVVSCTRRVTRSAAGCCRRQWWQPGREFRPVSVAGCDPFYCSSPERPLGWTAFVSCRHGPTAAGAGNAAHIGT